METKKAKWLIKTRMVTIVLTSVMVMTALVVAVGMMLTVMMISVDSVH